MFFARPTLFFALLLLLGRAEEFRINNAEELIDFSNYVNNGRSYLETTVYLDSDIDFTLSLSQRFEPIGTNKSLSFQGTFDGQVHTISGLALNSPFQYAGLFGYSKGATIKNVVLDNSCSFMSSRNFSNRIVYVGSIVGYCEDCAITGIVSMASAIYNGNQAVNIGGVIGNFLASNHKSDLSNCVNYGYVIYSGASADDVVVGGLIGACPGSESKYIQNCANYGTITYSGESTIDLYMGGIVGASSQGTFIIVNCVSGGRIVNSTQISGNNYIGSVVGYVFMAMGSIANCFWTSDVRYDKEIGRNESMYGVTVTNSFLKELTKETVDKLNEYAEKNSTWDKWFMLRLNGGGINNINQETLIVTQKHFPDPVKEENSFIFWCRDAGCTEKYDSNTTNITEITDLYAGWNKNIITFDFGNGTIINITYNFNETIAYPENITREGFIFNGWSSKPGTMPAENITVTAQWIKITPELVEIVFEKKDLKEEEIEEIIKEYTQDEFVIVKFEDDENTGEIKVIIKFEDREVAESFIESVRTSSDTKSFIKRIGFIREEVISMSTLFSPNMLFGLFV